MESDPIGLDAGLNGYGYVDSIPNMYIDPLGLFRWKDARSAAFGMIGNGVGIFAGGVLVFTPEASMVSKIVGYSVITKSAWGLGANWYNFLRAFSEDASYDIPSTYTSLFRSLATTVDPCNKNLLGLADETELALDLMSMKVSLGNLSTGSSGYLRNPIGYPQINSNNILTRPGLYGDFVSSKARGLTSGMSLLQAGQYSSDALNRYNNSGESCGCQ